MQPTNNAIRPDASPLECGGDLHHGLPSGEEAVAGGFPAGRSMVGYGRVMTACDTTAEPASRTGGSRSLAAGVVRGEHVDAAGPAGPTESLTAGAADPTESLAAGVVRGGHLQAAGPADRTDDSPEPGTGPDGPRRRPIGLWLVAAAIGPWLGAMLFLVLSL